MAKTISKIRFDKSGYYFIGLIAVIVLGFWKSYFSKFIDGTNNYAAYFHFHATMMALWLAILIAQPILIRKKKLAAHRIIGKISYVVMPLMLISVILILNSALRSGPKQDLTFMNVIFPVRDFLTLSIAFTIGTIYRKNINIHARAMIVTGIVFIEPSLGRFLANMLFVSNPQLGGLLTMAVVCILLIVLIVLERKQKSARWIFPSLLAVYVTVYALLLLQVQLSALNPFVVWFAKLPLT